MVAAAMAANVIKRIERPLANRRSNATLPVFDPSKQLTAAILPGCDLQATALSSADEPGGRAMLEMRRISRLFARKH
jgi:hypothetical protein